MAGLRRRFASLFYEGMIVLAVIFFGFGLPHFLLGVLLKVQAPHWVVRLHIFLLLMAYFVWLWLHGGQTLAMKTWRLRLVDASGGSLRPSQALLRYLAAWFSIMPLGIGILWALLDRDRQFLHDRLAGTRIIFAPPTTASPPPPAET